MLNEHLQNTLTMNYPASILNARWREALPGGNGRIGIAVYGAVQEETIMLTHHDLWSGSHTPELPDVSGALAEVRRLLHEQRTTEAEQIYSRLFKASGYQPKLGSPFPLGDLKIVSNHAIPFKRYQRSLRMDTGEIKVSWMEADTHFERSSFVSRVDDFIVCEFHKIGLAHIDCHLSFDMHDSEGSRVPVANMSRWRDSMETIYHDGIMRYAVCNDDGTDFGAVARVSVTGGEMSAVADGLKISHAERVLVYVKVFVKGHRNQDCARLENQLNHTQMDYDRALQAHATEHSRLFQAMSLNLYATDRDCSNEQLLLSAYQGEAPTALIEKMWAFGRYLLISSSVEGSNPCHLYGLWCGEYKGMWAFNMVNENLQMIYWQALSGKIPELLLAIFDYCDRLMDDFRENASKLFGCRGIYIPAPTTPESGLLKHTSPHIVYWTGGAGWLAQHYYDYFLFTGDMDFLRDRALPFLRETAMFYEDFFAKDADGMYVSSPSNSPENTPGNYWDGKGMGGSMKATMNATMDFAIAKEVLTHLVEGARLTGRYQDEMEKWNSMLTRIPAYQINVDGAIKEWMHHYYEDNYHHRHLSHLYPVFPGNEVTNENDPKLYQAFRVALEKRKVVGIQETTGWSLAHQANIYARMGEGDQALECLDLLSRSCVLPNLFTCHNDWRRMGIGVNMAWAPVQLDAIMGCSAAVQEMLLYSSMHMIKILPALPGKWRKGKAGPMLARGGIEVKLEWDQDLGNVQVELESIREERVVELLFPRNVSEVNGRAWAKGECGISDILLKPGNCVALRVNVDFTMSESYSGREKNETHLESSCDNGTFFDRNCGAV